MKIETEFITHKGHIRDENQDSVSHFVLPSGNVYIVADGMGGTSGGKTASRMAVSIIEDILKKETGSVKSSLHKAIVSANREIHARASSGDSKYTGMGTTIAVLYISDQEAVYAHAGDSRIYLYRNSRLEKLTKDHSKIQNMIDIGLIEPEDAADHPEANVITRCLGADGSVDVEMPREPFQIMPGDLFIICSDGLWGMVSDSEIAKRLSINQSLDVICQNLISDALNAGGKDNITVQLIRIQDNRTEQNSKIKTSFFRNPYWVLIVITIVLVLLFCLDFIHVVEIF